MRTSRLIAYLLILGTMLLAACASKLESVVETFYESAAAGNIEKATEQISFAGLDTNEIIQAKGTIQRIVGEIKKQIDTNDDFGLSNIQVIKSNIEGDNAKTQVKLIFNNGKDKTDSYDLVREDGKWKIKLF